MERLAQPKGAQSTIRVEPKVSWPRLSDDSTGPKDAEEFFKKFEGITGLANNGAGLNAVEMLVTLRSCLGGSRLQIFENIREVRDGDRTKKDDPRAVYVEIKQRLLKFKETQLERQMRVKREFDELHKTKNVNALQFEAMWEKALSELEKVGLGKTSLEKYLGYLEKVGPTTGAAVRSNREMRDDGAGVKELRAPKTWEEAHAVVVQLESESASTKAFTHQMRGGPQKGPAQSTPQ